MIGRTRRRSLPIYVGLRQTRPKQFQAFVARKWHKRDESRLYRRILPLGKCICKKGRLWENDKWLITPRSGRLRRSVSPPSL